MDKIYASQLPFALGSGERLDGLYADERADGSLSRVGYWSGGRLVAEVVLSETGAALRRIEEFQSSEDSGDSEAEQFQAWLTHTALRELQMRAKALSQCAFCGKSSEEVKKLIMGPRVGICDECVGVCADIVGD